MSYYNFTFDTVPYLGINLTPTIIYGFYAKIGHVKISIILTQRGTYERQDSLKCWVTSTSEKKMTSKLYQLHFDSNTEHSSATIMKFAETSITSSTHSTY